MHLVVFLPGQCLVGPVFNQLRKPRRNIPDFNFAVMDGIVIADCSKLLAKARKKTSFEPYCCDSARWSVPGHLAKT